MPLYSELSLAAQTAYAELYDMAQGVEMAKFSTVRGSFTRRKLRNKTYVYFNFRDTNNQPRSAYVGPESPRVEKLVEEFQSAQVARRVEALGQRAAACAALGCSTVLHKHFKIIEKLASYGFFRNGGVLIGTHAFSALGNMLGVKWTGGDRTMDVDFAHAGKNISIAMPTNLQISVHDAITSLEMGLLPIREFSGKSGAQYRNPEDPELRIDFCTPDTGTGKAVPIPGLGIALEPLKFMEFSLEDTTQGVIFSASGACVVNLPDPARFAVHKLIVYGERPVSERTKATKDVQQAAALTQWHLDQGKAEHFQAVWQEALSRGPGWKKRAEQGRDHLLQRFPALAPAFALPT
jgi:hypothetical protein